MPQDWATKTENYSILPCIPLYFPPRRLLGVCYENQRSNNIEVANCESSRRMSGDRPYCGALHLQGVDPRPLTRQSLAWHLPGLPDGRRSLAVAPETWFPAAVFRRGTRHDKQAYWPLVLGAVGSGGFGRRGCRSRPEGKNPHQSKAEAPIQRDAREAEKAFSEGELGVVFMSVVQGRS